MQPWTYVIANICRWITHPISPASLLTYQWLFIFRSGPALQFNPGPWLERNAKSSNCCVGDFRAVVAIAFQCQLMCLCENVVLNLSKWTFERTKFVAGWKMTWGNLFGLNTYKSRQLTQCTLWGRLHLFVSLMEVTWDRLLFRINITAALQYLILYVSSPAFRHCQYYLREATGKFFGIS